MMRAFLLGALLVLQPTVSMSIENTKITSEITSSSAIPVFKDYPSSAPYIGPAGKLIKNSELSKTFPTRLSKAMAEPPVIAGEYVITGWGCGGAGCYVEALVNRKTGLVIDTTFNAYNLWQENESGDGEDLRIGEWIDSYNLNSRLVVTSKVAEDVDDGNSREYLKNYYVINGNDLELIKTVKERK